MAGWETYNIAIPLKAWLSHYKPSVITNRDVSWLHIQSSVHPPLYDVGNADAAKEDWNRYLLFSLLFSLSPLYPSLSPLSLLSSPFLYIIPFLSLTSHPLFFFGSKSNMKTKSKCCEWPFFPFSSLTIMPGCYVNEPDCTRYGSKTQSSTRKMANFR